MFADPAEAFVVFERPTREQIQVLSRTFVAWQIDIPTSVAKILAFSLHLLKELTEFHSVAICRHAKDVVSTVMYWIIWDLVDCIKDLDVPPPIQSRPCDGHGPKWIHSVDLCRL